MSSIWFENINIIRGICVVLVIVGHVFTQTTVSTYVLNSFLIKCGKIIYSFHMPLFFILSGFLSSKILFFNNQDESIVFIKQRFFRLIVPYITMAIVYVPLRLFFGKYARVAYDVTKELPLVLLGKNPDGALWFLYVLFVCSVVVALLIRKDNLMFFLGCSLCLSAVTYIYSLNPLLSNILRYPFFFVFGLYLRNKYSNIIPFNLGLVAISLVFFCILNVWNSKYEYNVLSLITAISGSYLVYAFASKCGSNNLMSNSFELFGKYGMEIYILSEPIKVITRTILKHANLNDYIFVALLILISLLLPIFIVQNILSKFTIFNKLLFGKF